MTPVTSVRKEEGQKAYIISFSALRRDRDQYCQQTYRRSSAHQLMDLLLSSR